MNVMWLCSGISITGGGGKIRSHVPWRARAQSCQKRIFHRGLTVSALVGISELYVFLGIAIYSVFSAAGSAAAAGAAAVSSLVASVAEAGAAAAPPDDSWGSASDDVQRV